MMKSHVLIVDDEQSICDLLAFAVELDGYDVTTTTSGNEAVEHIRSKAFDLAVIDVIMPQMNGIEVLKKIKEISNTEVIVMTGYAELDTVIKAMQLGAYDYIIKPFDMHSIIDTIRSGIQKYQQKLHEIAQLELAEKEIQLNYKTQIILNKILRLMLEHLPLEEILNNTLKFIILDSLFDTGTTGCIFLVEDDPRTLVMKAQVGLEESIQKGCAVIPFDKCPCGQAALTQEIQYLQCFNDRITPHYNYFVPIVAAGVTLGVINIYLKEDRDQDPRERNFLSTIANTLAGVIQQKKTESALIREHNVSSTIMNTLPACIFVKDTNSRYITDNVYHARVFMGATPAEVVGKSDFDFFPEEQAKQYYAEEQEIIRSGKELVNKLEPIVNREGKKRWLLTTKIPLRDELGNVVGLIGAQRDITEFKQLEKEKQNFVSAVSHEIRTPLTSIGNAISIVGMAGELNEDQRKFISIAVRNIDRLNTLINQVLDISKMDSGVSEMIFEKVDVKPLVDNTIILLEFLANSEEIKIVNEVTDGLPKVYADENRLEMVLTNLIDNAVKFSPVSSQVTIEARESDGYVEFSVSNNGESIPHEWRDKIFDRFRQMDVSTRVKGFGLGLAICKEIVERHHGKIWVESEIEKGNHFFFTVPKA